MSTISVSTDGGVCRVTLNRPEKLNALSDGVRRELHAAFDAVADDRDVRVVVLSGAGRCFSAGADLGGFGGGGSGDAGGGRGWAARRYASGGWQRLLERLESLPQVTVASIHSHCVGGAALLAAACDIRIAADDVRVSIPEVAIGIPLTWAGIPRLIREIGLPMARDMVMTGRVLEADEVRSSGLAQRVVDAPALATETDALVANLLAMPKPALDMTKSMFAAISRHELGTAGWADADLIMWCLREPEFAEAAAEYVKRLRG